VAKKKNQNQRLLQLLLLPLLLMLHLLLQLLLLQLLLRQKQRSNLLFEERKSRVSGFFLTSSRCPERNKTVVN
jgi:hypothetical protein